MHVQKAQYHFLRGLVSLYVLMTCVFKLLQVTLTEAAGAGYNK